MPALDGTLGAIVIGILLSTLLFGIATLQTFSYYRRFTKDTVVLKSAVALLWLFELGHMICICHAMYQLVVTFYGQFEHLSSPPRSLAISITFTALVLVLVQTYFASRIRVLSGRWHLTIFCSILSLLRFAFSIRLTDVFWNSPRFSVLQSNIRWTFTTVVSLGPAVDLSIAASLCYFLWKIRSSQTSFNRTRTLVDSIIAWTIETTLLTSFAGVMELILFLARGDRDLLWLPFYFIQPKLFSNSMLASLNNRQGGSRSDSEGKVVSFESGSRGRVPPHSQPSVAIHMHRLTETDYGVTPAPTSSLNNDFKGPKIDTPYSMEADAM
ncbi:hypothetical protein B0H15DRAFT_855108 [Mycena belliarum]|uniref:DUF6534 domain-containing protein n=1 Tax=Mycena belliarum TaxID=1033014 RepID=A0AAD6U0X9_9AGAR|nr:hypothetical protein B0H15DRAFT_855108 [Mycena belliae]